jgi:hypothetical protein
VLVSGLLVEFEPTIGTWNYTVGDANYQWRTRITTRMKSTEIESRNGLQGCRLFREGVIGPHLQRQNRA